MFQADILQFVPRARKLAGAIGRQLGGQSAVHNLDDARRRRQLRERQLDEALKRIAMRRHPSNPGIS